MPTRMSYQCFASRGSSRVLGLLSLASLIIATAMLSSCVTKQQPYQQDLAVRDFVAVIKDLDVQLVDVRTPAEYAEGYIGKAINIDIKQESFDTEALRLLDPNKPIAVYCRSGARSAMAVERLRHIGFHTTIYNLIGGYLAYAAQRPQ